MTLRKSSTLKTSNRSAMKPDSIGGPERSRLNKNEEISRLEMKFQVHIKEYENLYTAMMKNMEGARQVLTTLY